jgi:disulfide bond formation protein DsbB
MGIILRPRPWYFIVAFSCAALLAYGYYVQYVDFLEPCPLCIFQRIVFMWVAAVALLAFIHNPGPAGRWAYTSLITIGGLTGIAIATRHLWLQSLPPDQVPECGMGLNYMLESMPFTEVLTTVFRGSGECATVDWTFLGLSMPGWTLIWYIGLTAVTIFVTLRANARQ